MNNNNISHFYFTDDILIGDPDIDADHRAFFEISNILNESIYTGSNILVISSAVLMLKEYVDGHFWREEKAMQKARYPYILKHKFLHDKFRRKLNDVIAAFDGGDLNAVYDLPKLVVSWLRLHITYEDRMMKPWINRNSVDHRPIVYLAIDAETD